ncbi:P-loop containing nucleoside triphosphate hydrolase protein [Aspergillus karnatakaensis]|uniref:P-loop containing nucleoside triphosphate hydrolase protein n=1 Tax=Aspergillus karnatakaensis TaxID=1810916 RepID=UPI003CCD55A2
MAQLACPPSVDTSFGPWAGACRGAFDFTLLFEESILSLPLQCIFLLLLPIRLLQLVRADTKIAVTGLRNWKLVLCVCLSSLNLVLLDLWIGARSSTTHTVATIPAAAVSLVASLGLAVASWFEHTRSIRPSLLISLFLFFSILLDLPRCRTLWMLSPSNAIPAVFTCSLGLRAIALVIESTEKRKLLLADEKTVARVSTSGPLNHSVFYWLTSLFLSGYKHTLSLQDLFPLSSELKTENLAVGLEKAWGNGSGMSSRGEMQLFAFARALIRSGRVLVLDEVASSLDDQTKKIINGLLETHFAEWTVISIIHQLDTAREFDKVAVMDRGRLVEFDKPGNLLEKDSAFAGLYRMYEEQGRGQEQR